MSCAAHLFEHFHVHVTVNLELGNLETGKLGNLAKLANTWPTLGKKRGKTWPKLAKHLGKLEKLGKSWEKFGNTWEKCEKWVFLETLGKLGNSLGTIWTLEGHLEETLGKLGRLLEDSWRNTWGDKRETRGEHVGGTWEKRGETWINLAGTLL